MPDLHAFCVACPEKTDFSIPVRVRTSARARNLLLRLEPGRGLEVVLPPGARRSDARRLLERKRSWIERTALRMAAQGANFSAQPPVPPELLRLRALGLLLPVGYVERPGNLLLRENGQRITLYGPVREHARVFQRLREQVRALAKARLPAMLGELARETGLEFDHVQVRCQKTRWGSCSVKSQGSGNRRETCISLNAKLLFLPPALCEQVLLHELCHTRHPDHSARFWALVARLNPRARRLERILGHGWRWVPDWWSGL